MSFRTAILAALIASGGISALAQPATAPATANVAPQPVERATADAVARLYATIAAERVNEFSLGEIIDRAGAKPRVLAGLQDAQQVGGPRAVGEGLVQVSLELRGDRAAAIIVDALNQNPAQSPVSPNQVAAALKPWSERAFRSTGDSRSAKEARLAKLNSQVVAIQLPDIAPAWTQEAQTCSSVAPDAGDALKTARQAEKAAREALRAQLSNLQLDQAHTVGSASAKIVDVAVIGAKIASVDYRADGSVEVSVSVNGQQLWQLLQFAAER
jgi:hypothetical protein